MKISFLVTVHDEDTCLETLLIQLKVYKDTNGDCEIVVLDDFSTNPKTLEIFERYKEDIKIEQHSLNKKFGQHKQYGNTKCSGEYVFQIDADEYLSDLLLYNLKPLIEQNPDVELFMIPRVNIIIGLTQNHVAKWGWRLHQLPDVGYPIINWPDFQFRFYKNSPDIKWDRDLHELIVGANVVTHLPTDDSSWAMFHPKTIHRQEQQNQFYISNFSKEMNIRHG